MKLGKIVIVGFSIICLGGSLVSNVLQGRRIYLLQQEIEGVASQGELPTGTIVPQIDVKDLNGQTRQIIYQGKPLVLYVFQPSCPWCIRNCEALKSLVEQVTARYDVIGLSLSQEGLAEFLAAHPMSIPVFAGISDASMRDYRIRTTPAVIVVGKDGRVLGSWRGAFVGPTKGLLEDFFKIRLAS
jgi:peroxiredoxin